MAVPPNRFRPIRHRSVAPDGRPAGAWPVDPAGQVVEDIDALQRPAGRGTTVDPRGRLRARPLDEDALLDAQLSAPGALYPHHGAASAFAFGSPGLEGDGGRAASTGAAVAGEVRTSRSGTWLAQGMVVCAMALAGGALAWLLLPAVKAPLGAKMAGPSAIPSSTAPTIAPVTAPTTASITPPSAAPTISRASSAVANSLAQSMPALPATPTPMSSTATTPAQAPTSVGTVSTVAASALPAVSTAPTLAAGLAQATRLTDTGQPEAAIATLRGLALAHPDRPEAANNLGVLLARQGQWQEARSWFDRALASSPAHAVAYDNLRQVHGQMAAQAYARALGLDAEAANGTPKAAAAAASSAVASATRLAARLRLLDGATPVPATPPVTLPMSAASAATAPPLAADAQPQGTPAAQTPPVRAALLPAAPAQPAPLAPPSPPAPRPPGSLLAAAPGTLMPGPWWIRDLMPARRNPGDEPMAAPGQPVSPATSLATMTAMAGTPTPSTPLAPAAAPRPAAASAAAVQHAGAWLPQGAGRVASGVLLAAMVIVLGMALLQTGASARARQASGPDSRLDDPPSQMLQQSAEARLIEVYRLIGSAEIHEALAHAESLVNDNPNFPLAQLVYGDLLLAQGSGLEGFGAGAARQGPQAAAGVSQLQVEAAKRLRSLQAMPPAGTVPSAFVQVSSSVRHAIAVDTSHSRLYVFENRPTGLVMASSHYIATGRLGVGKRREGDQRTPLGIYFISGRLDARDLDDFYGVGALPINYPNEHDRQRGRTGSDVWLHGVPQQQYAPAPDSTNGCIVLANDDLRTLWRELAPQHTPVVIARHLDWIAPGALQTQRREFASVLDQWRRLRASGDVNRLAPLLSGAYTRGDVSTAESRRLLEREIGSGRGKDTELRDVTVLTWQDEGDRAVITFREAAKGSKRAILHRQYWNHEQGQWKLYSEGVNE